MSSFDVRPLKGSDKEEWVRLRLALWPDADPEETQEEFEAYVEGGDPRLYTVVAERPGGRLAGLLELSLRAHAEGCLSSPVACVENWYVDEDFRRQGVARALLEAAGDWARHRGCGEVASSCVLENSVAQSVQEALGFEEVDRLVHYVYELPAEG